ncbi:regulatory signaling modulator protein AmpE [Flavobacterium sp. MXW15]|uniref:Regulatory signaling modulator protein AmpE n=1 Tax=Xanthomonas chitinilytica TaxID=2989819 RepID=A0ABT3JWU4_9XANT|nr:regulatory signaling modulator protein AmpE [Xanthomonas sp. H13-6]MCW4455717.1 regulatory signaling modulator protein AmpE [Flavobacterium sp. MXW15]MCW4472933.1 regulatory signaling modulator protein AmpE [Xanthomonas sp. H13-6]
MFTTLVAVIVALVLGHVAPALVASLRRFDWYGSWVRWLDAQGGEGSFWRSRYGIALAIVPLLLPVALLQWLLDGWWLGLPALLFGVVVMTLCWGPRDLDRDVEAVIDADDATTRHAAIAQLQAAGGSLHQDVPSLVEATMFNALRRWFATLLWFLLLGPVGAVAYRLLALVVEGPFAVLLPVENGRGARRALEVMEWPVAQLMALSIALVGNFDTVFTAWRTAEGGRWSLSAAFLGAVARASVSAELREEAHDYADAGIAPVWRRLPELRDVMGLVWRMLLLWLVLLALLIIAGWVS